MRNKMLCWHAADSLLLGILAGTGIALLRATLVTWSQPLIELLAELGVRWILALTAAFPFLLGHFWPAFFQSSIRSLLLVFRGHIGFWLRVTLGLAIAIAVEVFLLTPNDSGTMDAQDAISLAGAMIIGLAAGGVWAAWAPTGSRRQKLPVPRHIKESSRFERWLSDDQPIVCADDDMCGGGHRWAAERILDRLLWAPEGGHAIHPGVALIGRYGSGKSSICNLVEDLYPRRRPKPEVLFCRYDAWQFCSPEAAVGGLIHAVTERLLQYVDAFELWKVPSRYIRAIECGERFGKVASALLGGDHDPRDVLTAVGSVLTRMNVRLVVFVDDFDRIERECTATQQAVAKALNQLQNVPHIQPVICVGPTVDTEPATESYRCNWDLLKLTRFQQLVPQLDPEAVMKHVRQLREAALADASLWLPWSEIEGGTADPLTWYPEIGGALSWGRMLVGLIRTPRVLKSVLRETQTAWGGGLAGEIDWYDLVLANALRAAEPAVFELIARERDLFLDKLDLHRLSQTDDEKADDAKRLRQSLIARISSTDTTHRQIVSDAVDHLFPPPNARPEKARSQRICCCPSSGPTYLERYFHGGVPGQGIPDQPTLQFIRQINCGSFDKSVFQARCLASQEEWPRELEQLVQFAGLIHKDASWQICDTILEWLALPENTAMVQPDFVSYRGIMVDVMSILRDAGQGYSVSTLLRGNSRKAEDWILEKVRQYAGPAPFVAIELIEYACQHSFSLAGPGARNDLATCLLHEYIEAERAFLPVLGQSRYALGRLISAMMRCSNYTQARGRLTDKLICEADSDETHCLKSQVFISLVRITHPVGETENLENYGFSVDDSSNERMYAMDMLHRAIIRWNTARLPDKVGDKAREHYLLHAASRERSV